MALFVDDLPRTRLSVKTASAKSDRNAAVRPKLKRRLPPSRRIPQTTMPYRVCLRLAAAWLGFLLALTAAVLTIRWYG